MPKPPRNQPPRPDAALVAAAKRNAEKLSDSQFFVCLFSDKMVEDVIPLLQMGLAVYMDKPIYLLVPRGLSIPINLRRLALKIEEFDRESDDSMFAAMKRLLAHE